jgi:hypothetical protein
MPLAMVEWERVPQSTNMLNKLQTWEARSVCCIPCLQHVPGCSCSSCNGFVFECRPSSVTLAICCIPMQTSTRYKNTVAWRSSKLGWLPTRKLLHLLLPFPMPLHSWASGVFNARA